MQFCDHHSLWLIEDNCDALGSKYKGRRTGTFGDLGTSSFYPAHHITTGEGGAVYTNDPVLARIIRSMRDWGRDCVCPPGVDNSCGHRFETTFNALPPGYDHKYTYSEFGYNLKATDLQAAIGCAQLKKLPAFVEARQRNWRLLYQGLHDLDAEFILPEPTPGSEPSWFGFLLTVREGCRVTRDAIVRHLELRNIQTRMLFAGNYVRQPCFDAMRKTGSGYRAVGGLRNTDLIMTNSFWIGVYPGITTEMVNYMIQQVRRSVAR
jgi:CDP-6-deoxy-D-xylo-4-hexulose-3-dehydrase